MPTLVMANHVNIFFSAFQISKEWTFGSELCEMWTMSDVLCCTASILHLLAIAVDRSETEHKSDSANKLLIKAETLIWMNSL